MPIIISIEGNIGAGKSTIFTKLQHHYHMNNDVVFMEEPVDMWNEMTDENGENMLMKYYNNPEEHSFAFQTMVYASQFKLFTDTLHKNPKCKIIVSERSMDAGRNVFTKMLRDEGMIDEVHWKIYELLFSTNNHDLNYVFYVDVTPDVCHQRIMRRSRDGENAISIDYLKSCEEYYHKWLFDRCDCERHTSVVTLDGNLNDNGETCVKKMIENVDNLCYSMHFV